jgi:hypothetical protein
MKRRDFGLLAGTSLASAALMRPALAQSATPDPALLTTTLTPYGAERAGNADGSIPAWTGGIVMPAPAPDQPIDVSLPFQNDQPLYTVDASNMAQYKDLLTPALQVMISQRSYKLKVYPTHRTAAAPQYVYDNIAKNVTRAVFDPRGGRFGFTGAYGGIPFPIIDTANPQIGGAQLIWNHLTHFEGFTSHTLMSPAMVVINGKVTLSAGGESRFIYPYYDPDGSPETYAGYYSKLHGYTRIPSNVEGQETLTWHSTNVSINPDSTWTLLNGQGRVRKAPNESYDTPVPGYNGLSNIDESQCFYGNPSEFDWTYIAKKEMLVSYNNNQLNGIQAMDYVLPIGPNPDVMRWEKHRVWIVEASLHPGSQNVLPKRRFYIDEDTGQALLGEAYDANGTLLKCYIVPTRCVATIPMVNPFCIVSLNLVSGDYVCQGQMSYGSYRATEFSGAEDPAYFNPQQMAANASY